MKNLSINKTNLIFLGLTIFIFIPSLRVFFKYCGDYASVLSLLYFLFTLVLFYKMIYTENSFVELILSKKVITYIFVSLLLIAVWNIYPIADGLKDQMRGSDQDDCVILGIKHLLNFENPYLSKSYFGNPCSPGFGIFVGYFPFVYLDIYILGAPTFVLLLTYVLYRKNTLFANTFLSIIFSCILLLELMVVGSDLIYIGVGIALLSVIIKQALNTKNFQLLLISAILAGIVASTRVNFLVILFIASSYVYLHWKKEAILFFIISLLIAVVPSTIIYLVDPNLFAPLHLLGKSSNLMSPTLKYLAIASNIILFFWSLHKVNKSTEYINLGFFVSLLPSLVAVSISDLFIVRSGEVALWEGANYLVPLVPLATLMLVELKNQIKHDPIPL